MQVTVEIKVTAVEITNVSDKGWLDYDGFISVSRGNYTNTFRVRHTAYHKGKVLHRPEYDDCSIFYNDLRYGLGVLYGLVKDDVENQLFDALKKKWVEISKS